MRTERALCAGSDDWALFDALRPRLRDVLLGLIAQHRWDSRLHKLDLGVGVYRDDAGHTPVMRAVKAAERRLIDTQTTKAYLGAEGDADFLAALEPIVFGAVVDRDRWCGLQTSGGTGALRLGAELIALASRARVWVSGPTWPNHAPILADAGLEVAVHPYVAAEEQTIAFDAMIAALEQARHGEVVLLHGCCHNPTGTHFAPAQWSVLASLFARKGLIPFIDLAYQGLGEGLEPDAAGARGMLERVPEGLLAYSCDKNFGLYRERVGALWVKASSPDARVRVLENLLALARSLWSMPPDHGAAIVRTILEDATLRRDWADELNAMQARLAGLRTSLAAAHPRLRPIAGQQGLFTVLPLTPVAVEALRGDHGIYMAPSGRINIAGLRHDTLPRLVDALSPYLT